MRVTGVTCAKNEGPFMMEWVAYHRLIGFTDLIVFTNDCTDGTDDLMDRLDEMGLVTHLPNPQMLNPEVKLQAAALRYASQMRQGKDADWIIAFDTDEFVDVHVGDGMVSDLIDSYDNPDLISICQLQHGCSHRVVFEPGISIEQFPLSQQVVANPEATFQRMDTSRAIKTFVHRDAPIIEAHNHRPVVKDHAKPTIRWFYGADQRIPQETIDGKGKAVPVEGAYARASLNHYATRSMESFLVQAHRGRAMRNAARDDVRYWKRYNRNASNNGKIARHSEALKAMLANWRADKTLNDLQLACESNHRKMISDLKAERRYNRLYNRVNELDQRDVQEGVAVAMQ